VSRTCSSALLRADRSKGLLDGRMEAWESKTWRCGVWRKSKPTASGIADVRNKRSVVRLEAIGTIPIGQKSIISCSPS
jgi:hypothetical protein